jgi:hypothetical protein
MSKRGKTSSRRLKPAQRGAAIRRRRPHAHKTETIRHHPADLDHPRVRDAIRREAALLVGHPENDVLDDLIDVLHDWSEIER